MKEEYDIKNLHPRKNPYMYLKNHLNDDNLLKDLDDLYIENTITLSKEIIDNDVDSLNDTLHGNHKYNNKIFNNSSNDVQVAYLMGKCDGQYELADAWAERYKNNMQFEKDISELCKQSSHILDILFAIYKEPEITNEKLIKAFNIDERDMQKLIDKLIDIAAIVKYSDKCAFYELTDRAINYIRDKKDINKGKAFALLNAVLKLNNNINKEQMIVITELIDLIKLDYIKREDILQLNRKLRKAGLTTMLSWE